MLMGPAEKGDMMIEVRGSTMTQFAQRLSGRVDRSIVDKTGIAGMSPEAAGGDVGNAGRRVKF
jgi:hypothetical protein